jgi:hypothetical protein
MPVGASVAARYSGSWNGPWGAVTDSEGRFAIGHVAPGKEICVFVPLDAVRALGAPPEVVLSAGEGDDLDVGDLSIGPGRRLRGRVVIEDQSALPPNMHLRVWRERPYDRTTAPLGADGAFDIANLPDEVLHVGTYSLRPGTDRRVSPWPYHLSEKNASLDPHNPQHLLGRVEDGREITILLAPGNFVFPAAAETEAESRRRREAFERLRASPIRGAEAAR